VININIYKHCIQKEDRGNVFVQNPKLTQQMNELVDTINDNSVLPMNILTTFDATNVPSNGKFIRNYMSLDYYYNDCEIKFAGYPTDEHDFHLTNIEFETDRYNLFGITINDKKDDVIKKLHSFGFEEMSEKCSKNYLCFGNLDVRIGVHFKDGIVSRVIISVATYYLGNRMY
jgi:hypothetical protein